MCDHDISTQKFQLKQAGVEPCDFKLKQPKNLSPALFFPLPPLLPKGGLEKKLEENASHHFIIIAYGKPAVCFFNHFVTTTSCHKNFKQLVAALLKSYRHELLWRVKTMLIC